MYSNWGKREVLSLKKRNIIQSLLSLGTVVKPVTSKDLGRTGVQCKRKYRNVTELKSEMRFWMENRVFTAE